MKAAIYSAATGEILRAISGSDSQIAANLRPGEALHAGDASDAEHYIDTSDGSRQDKAPLSVIGGPEILGDGVDSITIQAIPAGAEVRAFVNATEIFSGTWPALDDLEISSNEIGPLRIRVRHPRYIELRIDGQVLEP